MMDNSLEQQLQNQKSDENQEQQQQQQQITPLNREFTFYFSSKVNNENWKEQVKQIGKFNTVQDFWAYYQHMQRPDSIPEGSQFYLFQNNIQPMWEDEANKNGGRFILKIKKKYANRIWEDLILGFIGEQCDEIDNVCGMNLNVKDTAVWIYIWIKDLIKNEEKDKCIRNWISKSLELPEGTPLDYRDHPKEGEQQQQRQHHGYQKDQQQKYSNDKGKQKNYAKGVQDTKINKESSDDKEKDNINNNN